MTELTVAFQGEPGAYSELAALQYYGPDVNTLPCPTFYEVFNAVEEGLADQGLLPIENSLAGSIHRNYDLLLEHDLQIVGEYHLRVRHCLMAQPGTDLADIQRVYSHPQALAQCLKNLKKMELEPVAEADTAGGARLISERQDPHAGALASRRAAEVYNLKIIITGMEDNPANFTRFLALTGKKSTPVMLEPDQEYKTSLVFSLPHQPGSLYRALKVFARRAIDLTKIESRPIPGKPWEYMFYIDFSKHIHARPSTRALDALEQIASQVRILGSYPRDVQSPGPLDNRGPEGKLTGRSWTDPDRRGNSGAHS